MHKQQVIITAPSLDPAKNVSGVSSVVQFIINNNKEHEYLHFQLGKEDSESTSPLARIKRILSCYSNWKRMLDEHPNAIIHYNWPLSKPSIIRDYPFMRYALKQQRKIIVHIHGGLFLTANHIPWYLKKIMITVFSWNVPFIVLSQKEKNILQNRFRAKNVITLPNCVELNEAERYNRVMPSNDYCMHLGYLGRIEQNKGMSELLEACKRLKREVPFVLHLAGKEETSGYYLPSFKEALGDSFVYEGVIAGEKKETFLKKIDVLTMPTYFEGLPMSLLECMSFGCVPVITPVGSIPSICTNRENALFIKVKDAESIVDAVKELWENKRLFMDLSQKAKETIIKKYSPKKYFEGLNGLYES